jgi:UDP-N-acetylglucosamine/UDP-N-acetylgalactosamine 4-epimerase
LKEKFIKNAKVLVTGGAGFIGSNLCESLLQYDNEVICLDNFSTGYRKNIGHLNGQTGFILIEGDIRNQDTCFNAMKGVDYVLHQAALGSVPRSLHDPFNTNDNNITGFLNILISARDSGVKRVIYAASSSTYGDSTELPKTEDRIGKPLSPYAVTKYVNELYAHVFHLNYGLDIIGLRYFNVFGRRQDPEGAYAAVIPKFVMQLMKHESPVINGDGTNSRDFTYIDNVIRMNHLAAISTNPEAKGQVFNAAAGERNDLNQLCQFLIKYLSEYDPRIRNIEVIHGPSRKGDIPHSLASIEKASSILGYSPTHGFEAGLKEAVDWYWKNLRTEI